MDGMGQRAETLVALRGLTVAFQGVPALRGIDLEVRRGEAVGLVGESGCGKSITWLAALGLLPKSARVSRQRDAGGQGVDRGRACRAGRCARRADCHDLSGPGDGVESGASGWAAG